MTRSTLVRNEAPKHRKRSTQSSKAKHVKFENLRNEALESQK